MKYVILLSLIILGSCNFQRDFLTGFVRAIENDDSLVLKENCFSGKMDEYAKVALDGFKKFNYEMIVEGISTMIAYYHFECSSTPNNVLDDFIKGVNDISVLKNLFNNALQNTQINLTIIKYLITRNYIKAGYGLGKLCNSIIYNTVLFLA